MSVNEDEKDGELLQNTAFSAHLQKYSYTPSNSTSSKESLQQASFGLSTKAIRQVGARSENARSPLQLPEVKKRKHNIEGDTRVSLSPKPLKRRTTTKERSANDPYEPDSKLVDSLRPGLMLVFCGLNPGLETARTGFSYAHPTNQFWPLLYNSGITPIRHKASDTHALPDLYNIGNTNLCSRATRSGDGLSKEEQADGAIIVEQKIALYRPEAVCVVGKGIWDTIYKMKTGRTLKRQDFAYGWQDEEFWLGRNVDENGDLVWPGARTFVCTSTSGLAADTKPAEKLAIMSKLGEWVKQRREELAEGTSIKAIKDE